MVYSYEQRNRCDFFERLLPIRYNNIIKSTGDLNTYFGQQITLLEKVTELIKQNSFWELDSRSAGEWVINVLWLPKVPFRLQACYTIWQKFSYTSDKRITYIFTGKSSKFSI